MGTQTMVAQGGNTAARQCSRTIACTHVFQVDWGVVRGNTQHVSNPDDARARIANRRTYPGVLLYNVLYVELPWRKNEKNLIHAVLKTSFLRERCLSPIVNPAGDKTGSACSSSFNVQQQYPPIPQSNPTINPTVSSPRSLPLA